MELTGQNFTWDMVLIVAWVQIGFIVAVKTPNLVIYGAVGKLLQTFRKCSSLELMQSESKLTPTIWIFFIRSRK